MAKDKKTSVAKVAGIAAAIAGVAAAGAASYYYLGSKDAEKHRKKTAKWAKDMQKDVVKKAKKLKKIDEQALMTIIDESAAAYKTLKDVTVEDAEMAANELKSGWEHVAKEVRRVVKADKEKAAAKVTKDVKVVTKAVKPAAKKVVATVKKAAKKTAEVVKKAPAKKVVVKKVAPAKKAAPAKKGKK